MQHFVDVVGQKLRAHYRGLEDERGIYEKVYESFTKHKEPCQFESRCVLTNRVQCRIPGGLCWVHSLLRIRRLSACLT
jgi:hypothetical protein